jgi:DNA invertase Pin-like site-specific DNA recombinase
MRAALYARVSTANNGQDPEVQLRELREYCQCRGWELTGEYVDIGISGTEEKRRINFVSLSEAIDTATPAGKLVFTVLGAVAELERSLIVERVKAGLRNARAKGKRLGRPPKDLDAKRIATLRAQGVGWRAIAKQLGVGVGTLYRSSLGCSKIQERVFGTRVRARQD